MATNYPTTLDSLTNPSSTSSLGTTGVVHSVQHTNINDAMEAVQARVGVTGSAIQTSIDYQLSNTIGGHDHDGTNSRTLSDYLQGVIENSGSYRQLAFSNGSGIISGANDILVNPTSSNRGIAIGELDGNAYASMVCNGGLPGHGTIYSTFAVYDGTGGGLGIFSVAETAGVRILVNSNYDFNITNVGAGGVKVNNVPISESGDGNNFLADNGIYETVSASNVANDSGVVGTTVSQALNTLNVSASNITQLTREPTGFPNYSTDSHFKFDEAFRTFTVAPTGDNFKFFISGTLFEKTSPQVVSWSNVEGIHWFYFDSTGSLTDSAVTNINLRDMIEDNALAAVIYWDETNSLAIAQANERHGARMDGRTHHYLHETFGARYESGLALNNIVADGDGSLLSSSVFGVANGIIWDEDIENEINNGTDNPLTVPAQIPIYYKSGSNGYWRKKVANDYPLIYSGSVGTDYDGSRPPYNEEVGGVWQLTEVTNNDFFLTHYFATNQISGSVVGIQGQAAYTTVIQARTAAANEISTLVLEGIPTQEFVAIASVIWQTSNGYTNAPKARIRSTDEGDDYVDFRQTTIAGKGATVNDHGSLSGLGNDDHIQYSLANGTRAFSGPVSGAAPTVDAHLTTKAYVDTFTSASVFVLTSAPSVTINFVTESSFRYNLDQDTTFSMSNPRNGARGTLRIVHDATGDTHVVSWSSDFRKPNGSSLDPTQASGAVDIYEFYVDENVAHISKTANWISI